MYKIKILKNNNYFTYSFEQTKEFKDYIRSINGKKLNNLKWHIPLEEYDNFIQYVTKIPQLDKEDKEDNKKVVIQIEKDKCVLKFDYNQEIIDIIKEIEGRKYSAIDKTWTVPINKQKEIISKLQGFEVETLV